MTDGIQLNQTIAYHGPKTEGNGFRFQGRALNEIEPSKARPKSAGLQGPPRSGTVAAVMVVPHPFGTATATRAIAGSTAQSVSVGAVSILHGFPLADLAMVGVWLDRQLCTACLLVSLDHDQGKDKAHHYRCNEAKKSDLIGL